MSKFITKITRKLTPSPETGLFKQYLRQNKKIPFVGCAYRSGTQQIRRVPRRSARPTRKWLTPSPETGFFKKTRFLKSIFGEGILKKPGFLTCS